MILRYCGRDFSAEEISHVRHLIQRKPELNRAQLSRLVCEEFGWLRPDGRLKDMSCRVAMLRMERDGHISLPLPQKKNSNGKCRPQITEVSSPRLPIMTPAGALGALVLKQVVKPKESRLWNELIARYHYLGYNPLPAAQLRYLIYADPHLLAALGFGAAAWKVAPRDRFIGWTPEYREKNLHLIVNNARFLILPWVTSRNLASRILAGVAKKIPADWQACYGYRPVLLETFVEVERFTGACYRAANWLHLGQTQGRGKLDRYNLQSLPKKYIYVYPLHKNFRSILCSA